MGYVGKTTRFLGPWAFPLCPLRLCGENSSLSCGLFVEDRVVNVFLHRFDVDLLHLCGIGSALRPFDQPADFERISLRDCFDGPIRAIAHPAGHLELLGAQSHRFAEEHTLDAAGDAKAAGDLQEP